MAEKDKTLVPNDIFDVMRALVNKLDGLAAYDKYKNDGLAEKVWEPLKKQDESAVKQLLAQIDEFAKAGRLKIA